MEDLSQFIKSCWIDRLGDMIVCIFSSFLNTLILWILMVQIGPLWWQTFLEVASIILP